MPGACLNSWQTNCDWTPGYLWHSWDFIQRGIFIALALMLAYTAFVVIRFSYHYYLLRRESQDLEPDVPNLYRADSRFLADLIPAVSMLRGIASAAPFLGLAGTCYGFLASLQDISGSKASVIAYLVRVIVVVPASTVAGILVAIAAALPYSLLRARVETLRSGLPSGNPGINGLGPFHFAQTLSLKKRFSALPAYALLAAPFLALAMLPWMSFKPYRHATGLPVHLPSFPCRAPLADRNIVLQVTEGGQLLINSEPVSWTDLPRRLSDIYRTRASREIYLRAEDGVPFHLVADAIDIARRSSGVADSLGVTVSLITPQAAADKEKCYAPMYERLKRHSLKRH